MSSYKEVAKDLARFFYYPEEYVKWAFNWGKGLLENSLGPREWQSKTFAEIGEMVRANNFDGINAVLPILMSTGSGHGIGKSAFVGMLIKWIMDTRPYAKGIVTANTSDQLRTKTWSEMAKWHKSSITKDLFTYHATRGNMCLFQNDNVETWRCDALTCKEENSESFAGLHASNSTPFYIFDESSGIPQKIFEVAQGGLTDGEPMLFMFGNRTRNTGFFADSFTINRKYYKVKEIDARDVEGTNKALFERWKEQYGEDSDYFRVRVRGLAPRKAMNQLISLDEVRAAMARKIAPNMYAYAPRVLGVDVAWFGGDRSCIWIRQGFASRLLFSSREIDTIDLAARVRGFERKYKTSATFIDAGKGNGVIDVLRRTPGYDTPPVPVYFQSKSIRPDCRNKRAEMWVKMAEWVREGGVLPLNNEIEKDLIAPEYFMTESSQYQLEAKEDMKDRGLDSPDLGDGLALTFAEEVDNVLKDDLDERFGNKNTGRAVTDYNVLDFGSNTSDNVCEVDYKYL